MYYLQVINTPPPIWKSGGPARQSQAFMEIMQDVRRGLVCDVRYQEDVRNHLAHVDIFPSRLNTSSGRPVGIPNIFKLYCLFATERKVLVHLLEIKSVATLIVLLMCYFRKNCKVVSSPFGQIDGAFSESNRSSRLILKSLFRRVDLYLCQNMSEKKMVDELFARTTAVCLPLILDGAIYASRPRIFKRWQAKIVFGYLGRATGKKGIERIIQYAISRDWVSQCKIAVPEINDYIMELKNLYEHPKICIETIDDAFNRFEFYRSLDVFAVLPTVIEETSLASLEALFIGCKVLINPNCEIPASENFPSLIGSELSAAEFFKRPSDPSELERFRELFGPGLRRSYREWLMSSSF